MTTRKYLLLRQRIESFVKRQGISGATLDQILEETRRTGFPQDSCTLRELHKMEQQELLVYKKGIYLSMGNAHWFD